LIGTDIGDLDDLEWHNSPYLAEFDSFASRLPVSHSGWS